MELFMGAIMFDIFGIALLQVRIKYIDTFIKYSVIFWEVAVILAFYDSKEMSLVLRILLVVISVLMIIYAAKKNHKTEGKNGRKNDNEKNYNVMLEIGEATVKGDARDQLIIEILSEDGKRYKFHTKGNDVESFVVKGKTHNYGG